MFDIVLKLNNEEVDEILSGLETRKNAISALQGKIYNEAKTQIEEVQKAQEEGENK